MPASSLFPALGALHDEQIVAASQSTNEPAWLTSRRSQAWELFSTSEPPIWRRTNLSKLKADQIVAPAAPSGTSVSWDSAYAAQGVVVSTLKAALQSHGALIEQHLGSLVKADAHKFAALQAALWQDGFFVYVPKGVAVEAPVTARMELPANRGLFAHSLVILERGASLTLIEEYSSADGEQGYAAPVTELFLGDDAQLRYIWAQTWGNGVYHVGNQIAKVGNNASVEWVALNLGATVQHNECETYLGGTGAKVEWMASTFAHEGQSLLNAPWLRHVGTNTEGHMDFKTVISGGGYTTFDGMIKIEKHSRGTISRLEEHAIHLSDKARSDSIPGLMIDTNDVQRAGHASTSGQVDEEMLFYMLSRGIPRSDAIHLIVSGFFQPVLDMIPVEEVRERYAALIEAKI